MKATHKTFADMLGRAAGALRVIYVCGADEAGAGDAAAAAIARLGQAELVELAGAELKRDPARLADEARSTSLFGDKRVIRVAMSGDDAHDAIAALIADPVPGWPVVAVASGASDKSRVAKLLADRPDSLVAVFHPPDLGSVVDMARDYGGQLGVTLDRERGEVIALSAALDTRLVRREIEKLALYCDASPQAPKVPTAADLAAIGAETRDDGMNALVNATLGGMPAALAREMRKLTDGDISPVGLLLALERRAVQLAGLAARIGPGGNVANFIKAEVQARRIFFKDETELRLQLQKWRGPRLERLLTRLVTLHREMMADSGYAQQRLAQALVEIARAAGRKG